MSNTHYTRGGQEDFSSPFSSWMSSLVAQFLPRQQAAPVYFNCPKAPWGANRLAAREDWGQGVWINSRTTRPQCKNNRVFLIRELGVDLNHSAPFSYGLVDVGLGNGDLLLVLLLVFFKLGVLEVGLIASQSWSRSQVLAIMWNGWCAGRRTGPSSGPTASCIASWRTFHARQTAARQGRSQFCSRAAPPSSRQCWPWRRPRCGPAWTFPCPAWQSPWWPQQQPCRSMPSLQ